MSHQGDRQSLKLLFEQGIKYFESGDMKRCLVCCETILRSDQTHHRAFNLAGLAFLSMGDVHQSLQHINQAFIFSQEEEYLVNIAEILRRCNKLQEAFDVLMTIKDKSVKHYQFNLGRVYADLKETQKARACYEEAIQQDPQDIDALFNLANLLSEEEPKLAKEYYERAYDLGLIEAGINLASMFSKSEKNAKALKVYEKMQATQTAHPSLFFNYANLLAKMSFEDASYYEQAKKYYKRAMKLEYSALYAMNYSQLLLRFGELKEGFKYAEHRFSFDIVPEMIKDYVVTEAPKTLYRKTVLVYYEQGYGDSIIFARFIGLLAKKSHQVILVMQKPLLPLFQEGVFHEMLGENVRVYDETFYQSGLKDHSIDCAFSLLSLPHLLKLHEELVSMLPQPIPIKPHQGRKIKIGFCFKSNPKGMAFQQKSIPLELLLSYMDTTKYEFHNLQLDIGAEEKKLFEQYHIHDHSDELHSFKDTQRILEGLDAIISIDSAIAHLGASLGMPTFVLLHRYYDWRFAVVDGKNLLYHENVYRYVQEVMGDWKKPLNALKKHLKRLWS